MAKPAFRAGAVHVRVPATSANLGPGFDALGLALTRYDDIVARVADTGLSVDVAGAGEDLPRDESHLVVRAMRAAFEVLGGQPLGLELSCANRIPHGRGLGSSAAAISAGILLARALVLGGEQRLPMDETLALAAQLEGHPDNVAACLLGGLTVAWRDGEHSRARSRAVRLECVPGLRPIALVPGFQSSTEQARGLLPQTVTHADAAFNAGRSALLVAALTATPEQLFAATEDRLHQRYRAPAMAESAELVARLRAEAIPAVISGAGPTVLVLADAATQQTVPARLAELLPDGWELHELQVCTTGAHIVAPPR